EYMDGIDGGFWNYYDSSYPGARTTFFAGTFCKHPLSMAAAAAVLSHLKASGPSLQSKLNTLTAELAVRLNEMFEIEEAPIRVVHFGSLFRFSFQGNMDLFFYHLLDKNIYIWEGRNCFLSTAHSAADLDIIVEACREATREMREGGFLAPRKMARPDVHHSKSSAESAWELTTSQKQLLLLAQSDPAASLAYNVPVAFELRGPLNVARLERALHYVTKRHEALRSWIETDAGLQHSSTAKVERLTVHDFSKLTESECAQSLERLIAAECVHNFDLARGPLFRISLARLEPERSILLLNGHHVAIDGWSMGLVIQEASQAYRDLSCGDYPRETPARQYSEYVARAREFQRSERARADEAFWLDELKGPLPVLDLPSDRTRPSASTYDGSQVSCLLERDFTLRLKQFGAEQGATLFVTLLAAWGFVLSRLSGENDIVVGTANASRWWNGSEEVVGYCNNMIPMRLRVDPNETVVERLRSVRSTVLRAFEHAEYPFSELIYLLAPQRRPGRAPVFDATFNLDRNAEESALFECESRIAPLPVIAAKYDLGLNVIETVEGLTATLTYKTGLFDRVAVERWLSGWRRVLEAMIARPGMSLGEIQVDSSDTMRKLLEDWSGTRIASARHPGDADGVCAHALFEANAASSPDAIAVVQGSTQVSYGALNARANQIARYLKRIGLGPEGRVALCMPRGAELITCVLGVLKSGAAYVPLDPAHPAERLEYILADSGAELLFSLSTRPLQKIVGSTREVRIDCEWSEIALEDRSNPETNVRLQNVAYLMYTSGSTGRPKGVAVEHGNLASYVAAVSEKIAAQPGWSYAALQTFAADSAVTVLFCALHHTGRLHLLNQEEAIDPMRLAEILERSPVDVIKMTPSHLRAIWTDRMGAGLMPSAHVIIGGEALPASLVRQVTSVCKGAEIWNHYGPTECTVGATMYRVSGQPDFAGHVAIGTPILKARAYILDSQGRLAPRGATGELCIGGAIVARGYWNGPALTAERFVPDPFARETGSRLYRTGDRVRWREDGTLEYLGRSDGQIKIRGYRVEPGEIEAILAGCPGVKQAAVALRGEPERLVAYVVLTTEQRGNIAALGKQVERKLPDHMRPSVYIELEQLPLIAQGKLDRKALPDPPQTSQNQAATETLGPLEEILRGIWSEVLGLNDLSLDANFFELGGHSLLATQVISRVRQVLGVEIGISLLFERPTIQAMADDISRALGQTRKLETHSITQADRSRKLPLSYAQQRLWFLDQLEPESSFYNCSIAVRLEGDLKIEALRRTLKEVVRRHEVLRTTFDMVGTEAVQVIHPMGFADSLQIPEIDLSGIDKSLREERAVKLAEEDARRAFNLTKGPLLRMSLVRLGSQDYLMLLTMHHIVTDGWSTGILMKEVGKLYQAYRAGESSPLEELPIQYADFAVWQREWLKGEILEEELGYWRKQLEGMAELDLPIDHQRPAVQSYRGAKHRFVMESEVAEKLRALSRREGSTLFMMLLGGFDVVLSRYSGQEEVVVGTDIANRNRAEVERLIGFFVNQLALRVEVKAEERFGELLKRVRNVCLEAYAHQDAPFEKLVEELQPERDLSRSPLFQTKLILQNTPGEGLGLEGLRLSLFDSGVTVAKFDLAVAITEEGRDLVGEVEYSRDLFEAETIGRLMSHYTNVLKGIVADYERPIFNASLLSKIEREQILVEWNQTDKPYHKVQGVHELFREQVGRTPEQIALISGRERVSYQELNRRANRLAHYLQGVGVGPEVLVGLCLERSVEMLVAVVGVLKAGGAYLPLDPDLPLERLSYILTDAGVGVTLTEQKLEERLPAYLGQTVCLDQEWERISDQSESDPETKVVAENLAYVIYTSGSTGRPKGVAVSHRNLINLVYWHQREFDVNPDDRATQLADVGFDASIWEVWPYLTAGARLYTVEKARREDVSELIRWIAAEGITISFLPTPLAELALREPWPAETRLRVVLTGGDKLRTYAPADAPFRVVNNYGPTENTVVTTSVWLENGREEIPPIGRGIANTQIYLLDERLEPAPIGVRGELYIGGEGLARGYWKKPGLTAEKFIPNIFSNEGGRLYRTGDLARYLPNGNIEFIGRIDNQVKMRGYRIELGEVEAALGNCVGVKQAAVAVQEDEGGRKRLVGYVVETGAGEAEASAIRAELQKRLPAYMVPSQIVKLE
ncbi:MAG: amino acid adenylation domain-containing protein, partial [Blastocatellia bacterium]|nr:amino acid adenylation domain-containing protein [Blastocatellia bacterium]